MDNRSGKLQGLYPLMDHDHAFSDETIYFRITFEYNSDTKGSDKMTRIEQLEQMLVNHGGMLLTSQVIAEGISKPIFYDFVRKKRTGAGSTWCLCVGRYLGRCHVFASSAL